MLATSSALIRKRSGGDGLPAPAPGGGFHLPAGTRSTGGGCFLCGSLAPAPLSHHWRELCGRCLSHAFHQLIRVFFRPLSCWRKLLIFSISSLCITSSLSVVVHLFCPLLPTQYGQACFLFPCLSLFGSSCLIGKSCSKLCTHIQHVTHIFRGPLFFAYYVCTSVVCFSKREHKHVSRRSCR